MYSSIAPYLFNFVSIYYFFLINKTHTTILCSFSLIVIYLKGLIDSDGYKLISEAANKFVKASDIGDWTNAIRASNEIEFLMQNQTYHVDRYNVIKKVGLNYYASTSVYNTSFYTSIYYMKLNKHQ